MEDLSRSAKRENPSQSALRLAASATDELRAATGSELDQRLGHMIPPQGILIQATRLYEILGLKPGHLSKGTYVVLLSRPDCIQFVFLMQKRRRDAEHKRSKDQGVTYSLIRPFIPWPFLDMLMKSGQPLTKAVGIELPNFQVMPEIKDTGSPQPLISAAIRGNTENKARFFEELVNPRELTAMPTFPDAMWGSKDTYAASSSVTMLGSGTELRKPEFASKGEKGFALIELIIKFGSADYVLRSYVGIANRNAPPIPEDITDLPMGELGIHFPFNKLGTLLIPGGLTMPCSLVCAPGNEHGPDAASPEAVAIGPIVHTGQRGIRLAMPIDALAKSQLHYRPEPNTRQSVQSQIFMVARYIARQMGNDENLVYDQLYAQLEAGAYGPLLFPLNQTVLLANLEDKIKGLNMAFEEMRTIVYNIFRNNPSVGIRQNMFVHVQLKLDLPKAKLTVQTIKSSGRGMVPEVNKTLPIVLHKYEAHRPPAMLSKEKMTAAAAANYAVLAVEDVETPESEDEEEEQIELES